MKNKMWLIAALLAGLFATIVFNDLELRSLKHLKNGAVIASPSSPNSSATPPPSGGASNSRSNAATAIAAAVNRPDSSSSGNAVAEFGRWAENYRVLSNINDRKGALAEGVKLAHARRSVLSDMIKSHPKMALEAAAPWSWRQEMPVEIVDLLEERVEGHGRLDVYCATPLPGANYREFAGGAVRYITLDGKTYRAYVYGRRVRQMSRKDLPVTGIAIGNAMAVAEEPLRLLENSEAQSALHSTASHSDGACALCGSVAAEWDQASLAAYGQQRLRFCSPSHVSDMSRALMAAEDSSKNVSMSHGDSPMPENLNYSYGTKKVLYMRVVFADDTEIPISRDQAALAMDKVNDFYVEASYNKTALISTITPVLALPQTKMYYAVQGPGALAEDAAVAARESGYDSGNYDLHLIRHTRVPGFTWGGLGGGGTAWLQTSDAGTAAHEIGHNYGLPHANYWMTRRSEPLPTEPNLPFDADSVVGHDSIIGAGDDVSYGDPYDIMGSGGGEGAPTGDTHVISALGGHFNAIGKFTLGWLPQSYVTLGDISATNRIYVHDTPNLVEGRSYALSIRKDEQREYWVSARSRFPNVPWLQNGVELHWGPWQQALGYSLLLDATPGSKGGSADAAIQTGHTFSDAEANHHITPVAKGGFGVEAWFDVVVNRGPFANNVPPAADFSLSASSIAVRSPVTFTAAATDANGDRLAYFWDFGDGTFGANAATVSKAWATNGDYVVRCEVSDMKGGVTSKHMAVRVGRPETLRISGQVFDTFGHPLQGVRISSGSITNNDLADDYQWTCTDSDGAFTLVNLTPDTAYPVGAYLGGYATKPLNFVPPITLADKDAVDVRFQAQPLPLVTVKALSDAAIDNARAGQFELSRTGDTNTSLVALFVLGGSAGTNDYKPYPSMTTQTNSNPNPFGAITTLVSFASVEFATGVVRTNITIDPSATAPSGEDKYVSLTVMHALQAQRITMVTNTNWFDFTGWETRSVRGQETWFQTDPDYVPGFASDARVYLRGKAPALPTVSIVASDATASENQNDAGMFVLTRYGRLDLPVTVPLDIGGTAKPGGNYGPLPASVTIPAGKNYALLPVIVRPNLFLEGNKTVVVKIAAGASYNVGNGEATVTIGDNDMPSVTLAAENKIANAADNAMGALVVTRNGDMNRELTVNYLITGTAISGRDYRALPGSVVIPAGQPSASIQVTPRRNSTSLGDRTVVVFLSDSPSYNIGSPGFAEIIIQDTTLPTVTVAATAADATAEGAMNAFTFRRTGDISRELWVSFDAGGTAKPLVDYSPIGNRIAIPARAGEVTIVVAPVNNGIKMDPAPNVTLTIVSRPEYNLNSADHAVVTLTGFENGQVAVGFAQLESSVMETGGEATVAVVVSGNPAEGSDVTVDYRITGGTAIAGVDYMADSSTGRLVFPHNPMGGADAYLQRAQLISLTILDNAGAPQDRTIVLTLLEPAPDLTNEFVTNIVEDATDPSLSSSNVVTNLIVTPVPMNAVFDAYRSHTVTLISQSPSVVSVEAADPTAMEQGLKAGLFLIRREGASGAQKVYFEMSGAAVNGIDYQTVSSPVEIPDGQSSVVIPILPVNDTVQEYMESVVVTLTGAPGARLGDGLSATVNIVDDTGAIEFDDIAYTVPESAGIAQIPIRRTGDTSVAASVEYALSAVPAASLSEFVFISAGTSLDFGRIPAVPGLDFTATNGIVTFNPGDTLQYIPVEILDDNAVEPSKVIGLSLRKSGDGTPLGGQDTATLTILDDDSSVEFAQAVFRANENATNALITVRRVGVATNAFSVEYSTADLTLTNGQAQAGVDYAATNGTLQFGPGQMEATFHIRMWDNSVLEGSRTALVLLTQVAGKAALGVQTNAVLFIADDECSLEFAAAAASVEEYGGFASIVVRRSGGTANPVSVGYATVAGTAKPNKEFIPVTGTISFAGDSSALAPDGSGVLEFHPGEISQTIRVQILDNATGDGARQFQLVLSNPRGPSSALPGSAKLGAQTNLVVTVRDDEMPGHVDYEFNPGQGADGSVFALGLQTDQKVLLGGAFTRVDDVVLNRIARLHPDGYLDSFLNPGDGADGSVYAIAVQPNGRVVLGGDFTLINGAPVNRIARLNADGTVDAAFGPSVGANRPVRALALQPDGSILIGGDFTAVHGVNRFGVARLNPNGSLDSEFNPGAGALGGSVLSILPLSGGKVLVAGSFTRFGGAARPCLARLNEDGSTDGAFAAAGGPDGTVQSLAALPDGRLVAGGSFQFYAGAPRRGIVRLNQDGSIDASFDPGLGATNTVFAVGLQTDGKVVAGGAFTHFNGAGLNRLVRLNPDGSVDDTFDIGAGADDTVRTLLVEPDSSVVIGGDFTSFRGLNRSRIARVHGDDKYIFNRIQFAAPAYRVVEDAGQCIVSVRRSGNTNMAASVHYLTVDVTARAGANYVAASGALQFAAGDTVKSFSIGILNDGLPKNDLTAKLILTNLPPGFSLGAQLTATLTIEGLGGAFGFASPNYTVNMSDGMAMITVERTGAGKDAASIEYATLDGTGAAGLNYSPAAGTLSFGAGVMSQGFSIPLLRGGAAELDKTVLLKLFNPRGATTLGSQSDAVLTIHDDNQGPAYRVFVDSTAGGRVTPPSGSYAAGTMKAFTAAADRDFEFVRWTGTTNSTLNPLVLFLDRDYSITAVFRPKTYTYDFAPPFTSASLAAAPWSNSGSLPWRLKEPGAEDDGRYSLISGPVADKQQSTMELRVHTRAGVGSFDLRVSSEEGWDFLEFRINAALVKKWSGELPWQSFQFDLPQGLNRLSWRYVKDNNFTAGLDAAFIGNLFVPVEVPRATLQVVRSSNSAILVWIQGQAGQKCVLEASEDLLLWRPLSTHLLSADPILVADPDAGSHRTRFYRARTP